MLYSSKEFEELNVLLDALWIKIENSILILLSGVGFHINSTDILNTLEETYFYPVTSDRGIINGSIS
jgi:hypothetical protein